MKEQSCIPPEQNAAFVWHLEDGLAVSTRPQDPRSPQICLAETSRPLLADSRPAQPLAPGQPLRQDDEYVRQGVCTLFLVCEPLRGWRHVTVSARRTRLEWAHGVRELLDRHYPAAERIVLVMDNLTPHTPASLSEAFPPAAARRLAERLEIHSTPKHGRWLNMAEPRPT